MDKFVKLEAIERIAKPMEAFHGKDEYEEGGKDWECPKCGTMVMATTEKPSMKCPCCGHMMEPAEDEEYEESEDESDEAGEYEDEDED